MVWSKIKKKASQLVSKIIPPKPQPAVTPTQPTISPTQSATSTWGAINQQGTSTPTPSPVTPKATSSGLGLSGSSTAAPAPQQSYFQRISQTSPVFDRPFVQTESGQAVDPRGVPPPEVKVTEETVMKEATPTYTLDLGMREEPTKYQEIKSVAVPIFQKFESKLAKSIKKSPVTYLSPGYATLALSKELSKQAIRGLSFFETKAKEKAAKLEPGTYMRTELEKTPKVTKPLKFALGADVGVNEYALEKPVTILAVYGASYVGGAALGKVGLAKLAAVYPTTTKVSMAGLTGVSAGAFTGTTYLKTLPETTPEAKGRVVGREIAKTAPVVAGFGAGLKSTMAKPTPKPKDPRRPLAKKLLTDRPKITDVRPVTREPVLTDSKWRYKIRIEPRVKSMGDIKTPKGEQLFDLRPTKPTKPTKPLTQEQLRRLTLKYVLDKKPTPLPKSYPTKPVKTLTRDDLRRITLREVLGKKDVPLPKPVKTPPSGRQIQIQVQETKPIKELTQEDLRKITLREVLGKKDVPLPKPVVRKPRIKSFTDIKTPKGEQLFKVRRTVKEKPLEFKDIFREDIGDITKPTKIRRKPQIQITKPEVKQDVTLVPPSYRQEEKIKEMDILKPKTKTRIKDVTKEKEKQKLRLGYIPAFKPAFDTIQRIKTGFKQISSPITKMVTPVRAVTPARVTPVLAYTPPITRTTTPARTRFQRPTTRRPPTYIPLPRFSIKPGLGVSTKPSFRTTTRAFRYTPSLAAIGLKITGKMPRRLTGAGIRPLAPKAKKKRRRR